jgi:malate dehydrogenase
MPILNPPEAYHPKGGKAAMKITFLGGGGVVGSAAAFHIAASGLADEILLVGRRENVVQHHAIDLSTAVSALRVNVRAGTYEDIGGSDVVINAAGIHQDITADRREMLIKNIALASDIALQIRERCPESIVITATNPVDPLNYATWRAGGFDRRRIIGYSLNDTLRFRERVARMKGVEVDRVEGWVIGEHGFTQVPLFSSVRVDALRTAFAEGEKVSIRNEAPAFFKRIEDLRAGRTAGWTCAIGLASMVEAIANDDGAMLTGSAVLEGEYGQWDLSMGVPIRVGREGIRDIIGLDLAPDEQAALGLSAERLEVMARIVDEELASQSGVSGR